MDIPGKVSGIRWHLGGLWVAGSVPVLATSRGDHVTSKAGAEQGPDHGVAIVSGSEPTDQPWTAGRSLAKDGAVPRSLSFRNAVLLE